MTAESARANACLVVQTGSHLYGTATPESDQDFLGVFLPTPSFVFGMGRVEQVDLSVPSKGPDGTNTGEAIDATYYEMRKFARLAAECNPNILEVLFAPQSAIVEATDAGRALLAHRHLFPYQGAYKRFIGYARSQQKRMVIRHDHHGHLTKARDTLAPLASDPETGGLTMNDLRYRAKDLGVRGLTFNDAYAKVGDLNFGYHLKVRKVAARVEERLAKATGRSLLMERYGFDVKFGGHLVRLLLECRDLLLDGALTFPLRDAEHLLAIRRGALSMEEVIAESDRLIEEIDAIVAEGRSPLPKKPQTAEVDRLVARLVRAHVCG